MSKIFTKEIDLGDGRVITLETGKLARQADGSVVLRMGNTVMLGTVVSAKTAKDNVDFMPLTVEYKESFSAMGRFPGGFLKREGRPGDHEILVARLVDRVLRPLFPEDYHADTFVTVQLISGEENTMPDAMAGLAASTALAVSNIPFGGPISEVRIARVEGEFIINPTLEQYQLADMDLLVGASIENIMMVEGEMNEVSEAEMLEAIKIAHEAIKVQCQAQLDLAALVGNTEKRTYCHEVNAPEIKVEMEAAVYAKAAEVAKSASAKHERSAAFATIFDEFIATLPEDHEYEMGMLKRYYHDIEKKAVRDVVLEDRIRLDGRKTDEIRPIWSEVDYLPSPHGSAVFTRGETQSLTTVTLGTKMDEKILDQALFQGRDKFLLHYNFPPFSTGDARPVRGVSRREIGHGNLAHRALKKMLPTDMPYTIRIVSDILESNGSSSMATVCAGTLALMDAGIQIKKPVTGIAMGLITNAETGKYAVLSDILGDEDHLGDMDFKVTGTVDGITACQMDIKVDGLSYEILQSALDQAKVGRLHIMDRILETMPAPREDYKPHAPRIETIVIEKDMIGAVIGPGGKIIQEIQNDTNTVIVIEEVDNKGVVTVSSATKADIDAAMNRIKGIVQMPEIDTVYRGKIKSIVAFGAFVEILPGKEGLLHISEIEHRRLEKVEDVLKEGEMVDVKLIEVDKRSGKLKLSRKALLPKPEREERGDRESRPPRRNNDR